MFRQVVHFKCPDREVVVEVSQRPNCLFLWLNLFRHLPNPLHDLCVSQKIMNELGIRRPEESFTYRSVAWLGPGARFLGAAVIGCQRFKVRAIKFSASVHYHDLRQTPIPPNALSEEHHTGAVARRIKSKIDDKQTPSKCIHQKRSPRPTERASSSCTDQFHIQQGMVEMADFEWPITMLWSRAFQFPNPRFQRSRRPFPLALERLLMSGTLFDTLPKGFVAWDNR